MKKDWILLFVTVCFTTAVFLGLLRWLTPQLIGIPADLQMVQVGKAIVPFYDGVFREEDYASDELILKDPYTNIRFRPLLPADGGTGPHDILGFRNTAVPNTTSLITLGDSQTYGLGEPLDKTWPHQLASQLQLPDGNPRSIYSMAVGGWSAVQYLELFPKAILLDPDIVIVAFYSGNDPLESFKLVYGADHWESLRPDPDLSGSDAPATSTALSAEDSWHAVFSDGIEQRFMPGKRLAVNNTEYPAARAGYAILAEVARRITAIATQHEVSVIFTVIPTRELAYADKVENDRLNPPDQYQRLVSLEKRNIEELAVSIRDMQGATYVDLVRPMQLAALSGTPLYPRKWDGHPGAEGYRVISSTLAAAAALHYD